MENTIAMLNWHCHMLQYKA